MLMPYLFLSYSFDREFGHVVLRRFKCSQSCLLQLTIVLSDDPYYDGSSKHIANESNDATVPQLSAPSSALHLRLSCLSSRRPRFLPSDLLEHTFAFLSDREQVSEVTTHGDGGGALGAGRIALIRKPSGPGSAAPRLPTICEP